MTTQELIDKTLQTLTSRVRPTTFPIGVKLLKSAEQLPAKYKSPKKMGKRWGVCQAIFAARCIGWMVVLTPEDQACSLAQSLIGFDKRIPFYTDGNLACGMFTETTEAGKNSEEVLGKFPEGEYQYLVIGPLEKFADLAPDFIWVYGMPGQITRLIQASLYKNGGSITSSFTGRGGCISAIAGTINKQACQVVVNGNGERVFAHAQDIEMSFTIPWNKVEEVMDGLEATHKNGVRYPYPAFFNYTPDFPPKYQKLEELWQENE
ncbi:MAG: DUF169 domain-containing protein [Megasphaera massiliensis]|uniref:DUF169 domain-containing protein n=1 Tax=Megasphaera massiliensis TaxID=1232428 RepID=UPI002F94434A